MTLIASKPRLTADEFLSLPESRDFELIDGVLVERKGMGALACHIAAQISMFLNLFCREHKAGWVFDSEASYQCFGSPHTVRRADVSFVRAGRFPGEQLPEGYITIAPDLTVEVISPSNAASEIETKVAEFFAGGSQLIWIVYPSQRKVHVRRPDDSITVLGENGELSGESVLPGFKCSVRELFPPRPLPSSTPR